MKPARPLDSSMEKIFLDLEQLVRRQTDPMVYERHGAEEIIRYNKGECINGRNGFDDCPMDMTNFFEGRKRCIT